MPYYSTYYRKLLGISKPKSRPQKRRKRQKPIPKPALTKTKKIKVVKQPPRKAHVTYSKRRRGQLMMKPQDPYEKQMIKRIQRKSGMTYIQATHLVRKSRESDVDVEHGIDWSLSKDRQEQYEFASEQLDKLINPMKHKTMRDLMSERSMYGF